MVTVELHYWKAFVSQLPHGKNESRIRDVLYMESALQVLPLGVNNVKKPQKAGSR